MPSILLPQEALFTTFDTKFAERAGKLGLKPTITDANIKT
jgi:hypothetical protein